MDIKQLHYFITIADAGSISAAARILFMSQPPLSNQMRLLEEELGCRLFDRGARTIHLTPAGITLYSYAKSILNLSDVAIKETMSTAGTYDSTIRIGIVSSVICTSALDWISNFGKLYPDIHIEITEGNTYQLIQKFNTAEIHLAILRTPFHADNLNCYKLFTDNIVAVGRREFFENKENNNDRYTCLAELSSMPLILYRRWESIISRHFHNADLPYNTFCINDDARTTIYFVESGLGVGLVPMSATALIHNDDIIYKPITDCSISSDVLIAFNPSNHLPEYSKLLLEYIKSLIQ